MNKYLFSRWRRNFFTGLAIVLPVVLSIAVVVWVFRNVSSMTDLLLFFVPKRITHGNQGLGDIHWYWSLFALLLALLLITGIGRLTRYYFGVKAVELVDLALLRTPLLNKIYGTLKQVNEAFTSDKKNSFKHVVLVEFPRPGQFAIGFISGEASQEVQAKTGQKLVGVFVPTTPNPTSGFLVLVPEDSVKHLDMSVADGIKYIISLGAVNPDTPTGPPGLGNNHRT